VLPPYPHAPKPEPPAGVGKTARALAVMAAALAVPYASPKLARWRVVAVPWEREAEIAAPPEPEAHAASVAPVVGEQALPASDNLATINNALPDEPRGALPDLDPQVRAVLRPLPVEDPSGHALDAFFRRLERTDHHDDGATTRILHYGDSTIASDYISGTVRRRLQARFGDGGHGFILIANPWEWYFHNDVFHASEGEWAASRLAGPVAPDGMYGIGGVSFTSYGGGLARFGTAGRGQYGRKASRFDLYYLEQPGGGNVELTVRGAPPEHLSTRGGAKVARVHSVHTADGDAHFSVRAAGGGPVRLFGVALERDTPGVVYDALGSHAAMAVYWQRQDRAHWKAEMDLRDPALVVLQYGTNESDLWRLELAEYERALGALLDEVHEIAPRASVLVVEPLDRAEYKKGRMATKPVIFDIVAIQRKVALSHGAALWATFDAMGGAGAMVRWVKAKPALAGMDLTHPTPLGAEVLGDMLSDALVAAYEAWKRAPRAQDAGN
jgi:lysophospholipase L1-like esterase